MRSAITRAADAELPTVGGTPLMAVRLRIKGLWRTVWLKLEAFNPTGSSKDRTALALINDLKQRGRLASDSIVVESTSGNLGVGLAFICRQLGYPFVAVIDPKTTPENRAKMEAFGALIDYIDELDEAGGYLLSRLRRVEQLSVGSHRYVWTDQYGNPANPAAHYSSTGPEIYEQMNGEVPAVFVAVSTGGTLAGVGRYLREVSPRTRIVAVDAHGSVVFGGTGHPRKLTGIGSARPSRFIQPSHYDLHVLVSDIEAFTMCRALDSAVAIRVGGSSGAVLSACATYLADHPFLVEAVCICPDGGENYSTTIFDDRWLLGNGFAVHARPLIVEDIAALTP